MFIFNSLNVLELYFHISQGTGVALGSILYLPTTTTILPPSPSPVFSINLDLSGEQVSSPGQIFLHLFFTVCLATQQWTSGLSPNWLGTDPHDMSICETRPCSTWKKNRRLQSTTVHCQSAKKRDG